MKRIISVFLAILILSPVVFAADRVEPTGVGRNPYYSAYINDMIFVRDTEYSEAGERHTITAYDSDGKFLWESEVTAMPETLDHGGPIADPMIYEGKNGIIIPNGLGVNCLSYKDGSVLWQYSTSSPYVCLKRLCSDNEGGVYAVWAKDYTYLHGMSEDYMAEDDSYFIGLEIRHISTYGTGDAYGKYEIGNYLNATHVHNMSFARNQLIITGSYDYDKPFIAKFSLYESGGSLELKKEVLPDEYYEYVINPKTGFLLGMNPRYFEIVLLDINFQRVFTYTSDYSYSFGPYGFLEDGNFYFTECRSQEDRNNGIVHLMLYERQEATGLYTGTVHKLDVYSINNVLPNLSGGYTVAYGSAGESGLIFYDRDFKEEGRQIIHKVDYSTSPFYYSLVNGDKVIYHAPVKRKSTVLHSAKHALKYNHDEVF